MFPGVRISQLRAQPAECIQEGDLFTRSHLRCYGDIEGRFTLDTESKEPFGSCPNHQFTWEGDSSRLMSTPQEERETPGQVVLTKFIQLYPAMAFPVILPNYDPVEAKRMIESLSACSYIDLHTKIVQIRFNVYNPAMGKGKG